MKRLQPSANRRRTLRNPRQTQTLRKRLTIRPNRPIHKLFFLPDRHCLLQRIDQPPASLKRRPTMRRSHHHQHTRLAHHAAVPADAPAPHPARQTSSPPPPPAPASAPAPSPDKPHSRDAASSVPAYCPARSRRRRTPHHPPALISAAISAAGITASVISTRVNVPPIQSVVILNVVKDPRIFVPSPPPPPLTGGNNATSSPSFSTITCPRILLVHRHSNRIPNLRAPAFRPRCGTSKSATEAPSATPSPHCAVQATSFRTPK